MQGCHRRAEAARGEGLKFGVSNHSSHAWHWWQTAYGYDAEGPFKGRRYDTGDKLSYLKANIILASEREDLGPELCEWLREYTRSLPVG